VMGEARQTSDAMPRFAQLTGPGQSVAASRHAESGAAGRSIDQDRWTRCGIGERFPVRPDRGPQLRFEIPGRQDVETEGPHGFGARRARDGAGSHFGRHRWAQGTESWETRGPRSGTCFILG
jgi:hypothetical protein